MRFAYEKPDGEVVWIHRKLADGAPPHELELDGVVARRSFRMERVGVPSSAAWPMACVASGVHPDQAQELRDTFERLGVPTEVNKDGDPVYTSPSHRRKALAARGFYDRAAWY